MTKHDFIRLLKLNQIYNNFIYNFNNNESISFRKEICCPISLEYFFPWAISNGGIPDMFYYGFDWRKSKEGYEFWKKIFNNYCKNKKDYFIYQ